MRDPDRVDQVGFVDLRRALLFTDGIEVRETLQGHDVGSWVEAVELSRYMTGG